jgi:hypothetical protein
MSKRKSKFRYKQGQQTRIELIGPDGKPLDPVKIFMGFDWAEKPRQLTPYEIARHYSERFAPPRSDDGDGE